MGEVSTIGLDIAKSVFQIHGVDAAGAVVVRKRISRLTVFLLDLLSPAVEFHHAAPLPSSRTLREGQMIHEKTTVSLSLRFTAIGNDVTLPSGTSSPQHSTSFSAPCSLKTTAAASACFL
jgi:hypothetical protein